MSKFFLSNVRIIGDPGAKTVLNSLVLNGRNCVRSLGWYYILDVPVFELKRTIFNFFRRVVLTPRQRSCKLPQNRHRETIISGPNIWMLTNKSSMDSSSQSLPMNVFFVDFSRLPFFRKDQQKKDCRITTPKTQGSFEKFKNYHGGRYVDTNL